MAETINFEELAKQDVPGWGVSPAPAAAPPQGIDFESLAAQDVPGWESRPAPAEAPPGGLRSLTLKSGVDVTRLATEAHPVFVDLDSYLAGQGIKGGVVTSGYQHRAQPSLHSHGRAVDIAFPSQNMPQLAQQLQQQGFSAHYERKGQVNANGSTATGDHIHFNLYPRTRPRTVGELRQAERQSVAHEYPTTPGAPPPTQPTQQPTPAPKLVPTITFRKSPAEQASADAEAAWASAPPIARDPRHPVAETGPIRDLLDRRVAAVRAVLQDPQIGLEMQHRAALLGTQYKELAKREVLYKKGQLSDDGVRQYVHDVAQYQANTTALEQRRQQVLHYGRLGQQLGEHGYQLPQGQYREETPQQTPGTLAAVGDRLWNALPAPIKGAARFVRSMSGLVSGADEAKQYRAHEYGRPDLMLPPLTGHTPQERRAQIDAKNSLMYAIRGAASELVGGRAMSLENVRAGVVKRLGRTLTPWEQRLYPTLFKIAGVEARAGAQEATGAATDITMLAAGGPLAHGAAGLAEKAIGGTVARGLERGGAAALAARAGRYLIPKAVAGVAAGGGLGAPLAAGQAVAAGATPKETLAAAGRGFALGSALGVLTEVGLGALGAGLGKAGEKVSLGQLRLRAAATAKTQAAAHGLTPAEVPVLRERIVEMSTASHEQQWALAARLKDDLDTRSPEQPLVAPAKPVRGKLSKAPSPTELPAPTTFKTSKGSEYTVDAQGRTQRTKVVHEGHLPTDVGLKNVSDRTYFTSEEDSQRLGMHGSLSGKKSVLVSPEGKQALLLSWNDAQGKWGVSAFDRANPIALTTTPQVGSHPLELWRAKEGAGGGTEWGKWHPGNAITEISAGAADTAAAHPVTTLQRATPEEVVRRGSLAEDPVEQARHADWTERQQRRTQQYDFGRRPLPIDTAEQYANEWQTPKNPAYRDYTNLRSRARQVATDDPALAQKLTAAADRVRENWTYAFRDQHFRQQGFAEEFLSPVPREVPTDLSPWRKLVPEERAKLTPAERDALLRQDVTHSLQTLDPDHVPRTEIPKVAAKNLENYADQLHQQAQDRLVQLSDEAAARGAAAPPPAPTAEATPAIPPVPAEVAPAEPPVGAVPGEVAPPSIEESLAVPKKATPPPAEQAATPLPPAKHEIVREQAARVEQEYRKQGYSPAVAKSQGEAVIAQARAETPKAAAIRGDAPPETATSGGGGGVGVPPPAGQGPAAELPKIPKGMRPGRTIIRPRPENAFPQHAIGPKEWQFEGSLEKAFQDNFGPAAKDLLDSFREVRNTLRNVEDFTAPGQRTNIAHKLSKTPFFANVRQKLMSISTGMGKSTDDAMNHMFKAYGKLEPHKLMLLDRVGIARDLWESIRTQLAEGVTMDGVKLPEPFTVKNVSNELLKLEKVLRDDPNAAGVHEGLEKRKELFDTIKGDYSNAYEAVTGRRPNLSRRDYVRHEVFFHALGKAGLRGGPEGLGKPFKPSYLMKRRGSTLPYNMNILDADHSVLASMIHHTQIFKAWKEVMGFDVRHQLETQAALWRMGHTVANDPTLLKNLTQMANIPHEFPDAADGRHTEFLANLGKFAVDPTSVDTVALGNQALDYVKWLRTRAGGVPTNIKDTLPFGGVTAREAFHRNLAGKDTITYRDLTPDGYREIKGVGNVLQTAYNMTNGTIDEMLNQHQRGVLALPAGEGAPALPASTATPLGPKPTGTLPGEVRMGKLVERAPRNDSIIVPKELARVLEGMHKQTLTGWNAIASTAWRRFNSGWKNWELMSPFTAAGYFTRKLSGELEAVAVVNPRLLASKHPLQATKELYGFLFKGAQPSEKLEDAMRRGLFSGIFVNEGGKSSRSELQRFTQFTSQGTYPLEAPAKLAKAGMLGIKRAHELQEGILRYAQYTDALEQLEKTGKLRNYGASVPEELEALHDPKDKAWKYSNDLLGAYDEISVAGQWLRQNLVPFWSFKEVNAKRWYQIQRNAWDDPALAAIAGRRVLGFLGGRATDTALTVGAAKVASLGAFYLKATALSASLDWYNRRFHMEEEMSLSPQIRAIPHIILGRGPDGRVNYISRLGTIWEVTSHFGLQNPGGIATMWANGKSMKEIFDTVRGQDQDTKKTPRELMMEGASSMAHAVVGQISREGGELLTGVGPVKDILEFATNQKFDPEKMQITPNQDKWQRVFNSVRLGDVYDWFKTDKARRPGQIQGAAGVKTAGYHEGAYSESRMWASEFSRHFDPKEYTGYSADDPKTVALYQAVQAKKWNDTRAWKTNLLEYRFNGGTDKTFDEHLTKLSPLGPLPVPKKALLRQKFLESLSDDEWKNLVRGYDYWASTWTNTVNVYDKKSYEQPKTPKARFSWTVNVEANVRAAVASNQEVSNAGKEDPTIAPYLKQKETYARTGIPPTTPEPKR